MNKFCTRCGSKLKLRSGTGCFYNSETGEIERFYQQICPNNKADSEGHSDDIIDLNKKEYEKLLKTGEFEVID